MDFDKWCAAHGVYLNDSDDAAKAAKGMARRAWDAAVSAERERCAKLCEERFSDGALDIADAIRKGPNA